MYKRKEPYYFILESLHPVFFLLLLISWKEFQGKFIRYPKQQMPTIHTPPHVTPAVETELGLLPVTNYLTCHRTAGAGHTWHPDLNQN